MFVKTNPKQFPRMADVFPRNRRDNSQLCQHSSRTALMRRSVFCMAPIVYNKFPNSWKELRSESFKSKVKSFLASKAYYDVNEFLNESFLV